jgi:hypothetical protein
MTRFADRVKETTTTTGTGTVTLAGAAAGFQTFLAALGAGPVYYAIVHQALTAWEVGIGTLASGPDTLARTTVLASSNAGAAVNFAAGVKDVFCTAPAAAFAAKQPGFLFTPESATFGPTNFPELKKKVGTNWVDYSLGFDTTTAETAYWRFKIPTTASFSAATIKLVSRQAAQVSGTVGWAIKTKARVDGDAYDVAGNLDTVSPGTVKGTAGMLLFQSQALTVTGWVPGAEVFLLIQRDVAADTCTEDAELLTAAIELS